jgi:addiction module HigA family antidote
LSSFATDSFATDSSNADRTSSMTRKLPKRGLPPPGEVLREGILPALDRPKTEIAKLLGVSRQTLYDIIGEKQPVTPVMALRLGKLCGNGIEGRRQSENIWDVDSDRPEFHRLRARCRNRWIARADKKHCTSRAGREPIEVPGQPGTSR